MKNQTLEVTISHQLKTFYQECDALIIAAGAGMGADSGLSLFRGKDGLWTQYAQRLGRQVAFADIAQPKTFIKDIQLAWGFYGMRLLQYRRLQPHAGFRQLLELAQRKINGYYVYTSNVDGHFQKAGFDPSAIIECHGSIHFLQPLNPTEHNRDIWLADGYEPVVDEESGILLNSPPLDSKKGFARPNILMFNDWQWINRRTDLQRTHFNNWFRTIQKPLVIEIGAGSDIPTVKSFCSNVRSHGKAFFIRINPEYKTIISDTMIQLNLGAKDGIQLLYQSALNDSPT